MSMRATFALILLIMGLGAVPARGQQLEFRMISSGPNRPGIALWNSPLREILAGLHAGMEPAQLAAVLGLSQAGISLRIDSLRAEGAVSNRSGVLRPTCMVVTADEGASLAALATDVARRAMPLMRQSVRDVQAQYRKIKGLQNLAFNDVSFFLVSDVLLDNWQIAAVEERWLKAERPLRGKSRYYCAIFARGGDDREAFGIFGNQMSGVADGRLLGVYGNRRGGRHDLSRVSGSRLAALTSLPEGTTRGVLLSRVLDQLQQLAAHPADFDPPPRLAADLETMGLTRQGQPLFAVLDTADNRQLGDLATSLTDSLISFLESVTPQLRDAWTESSWRRETTFEEFRIWWYHFFYTAVTEELAREGVIHIPETGLFHYILVG